MREMWEEREGRTGSVVVSIGRNVQGVASWTTDECDFYIEGIGWGSSDSTDGRETKSHEG